VQCTSITKSALRRRTDVYTKLGWYVLWLCPAEATVIDIKEPDCPVEIPLSMAWQKTVHNIYGQLHIWTGGQTVVGVDLTRMCGGPWNWRWPHLGTPHLIGDLAPVDRPVWIAQPGLRDESVPSPDEWDRDTAIRKRWSEAVPQDLRPAALEAHKQGSETWRTFCVEHGLFVVPGYSLRVGPPPPSPPHPLPLPAKLWSLFPQPPPPKQRWLKQGERDAYGDRQMGKNLLGRLEMMQPDARADWANEEVARRARMDARFAAAPSPHGEEFEAKRRAWMDAAGVTVRALLDAAEERMYMETAGVA
jgi:hypothetical protein